MLRYKLDVLESIKEKGFTTYKLRKAKIIGRVCMDSFMIDATEIPDIKVGDVVYIWDNENITLDEVARKCDTINYEILSCISNRVPREFV